jgi:NTE family protein
LLSYRPGMEEPGPEKSFELSPAALAQRWRAGLLDMDHALNLKFEDDFIAVRRK